MANQYTLPHTDRYTLTSISYCPEDGTMCENCGKYITNIATVKNQSGKCFHVGMDCASTLTGIGNTENFEFAKMSMRDTIAIVKAIKEMNTNGTLKVEYPNFRKDGSGCFVSGTITVIKKKILTEVKYARNIWETSVLQALPASINALLKIK